ncbi:MAG: DNA polymerase III subunit delta [Bacteroidetes bacterium]|nr:DNA polymerase III subunit delta [Bacteroidota bacterium]
MAKTAETISKYLSLSEQIGSGKFTPLYLLYGEETYFIDSLVQQLENAILPEAERSFNQSVLYGRDIKINDLMGMARRYPMMSKYQVILVKEAQDCKDWEKMLPYFESPLDSTILILAYKNAKPDKRQATWKPFQKHTQYEAEKMRDYQIKDWIPEFVRRKGRSIDRAAVDMIVDFLGADLTVIHNELEKIFITVKEDFIRSAHIEANVGLNREYNVFELQSALGQRNFNRSVQIAHQIAARAEKGDIMRMVPVLFSFFSKILQVHAMKSVPDERELARQLGVNPFFVKDYLLAARNYKGNDLERVFSSLKYLDLRLKGVHRGSAEDGDLLIETVLTILKN